MFVHVVDINLPEQQSNVPLEGNWHFFLSLLNIVYTGEGLSRTFV